MTRHYIVNVEVAVVHDGRYLMIVRSEQEAHAPGMLSVPGGKVEDAGLSENILEETARREAREEAGVEIGDELAYIESKSFIADDGDPVVDIVFLARHLAGAPSAGDPAEVASLEWMTADEVVTHPKSPPWLIQSIRLAETKRLALGW